MNKIIGFGEKVEGYNVPVLNEREVRASAGILFLFVYTALMFISFTEQFLLMKYFVVLFLADFIIRVFVNPRFSPSLIIGRFIVGRQNPEYVGAPQKKFAWVIGLILASVMFILMVVMNTYSFITGIICMTCLIFLFFESVFGICLGCFFYKWLYKEKTQYCPGEICDIKAKKDIQKISLPQVGIVLVFVVFCILVAMQFNASFSEKPKDLFQMLNPTMPDTMGHGHH